MPRFRECVIARVLCVMFVAIALKATPAEARRVALIVGNSNYSSTAQLVNPIADSELIAEAAVKSGFEVTLATDLTKDRFDQVLRDFRAEADGAEVAMIYYAGHGVESLGRNWIIPVDASLKESRDLRFEAIELDGLLETLYNAKLRMVILDACRNSPFGNSWRSNVRSVPRGLAEIEVEGALVIFAAAGGRVALDGDGDNSPFALSLANRLPQPGLSIHRLGSVVREDVVKATGGQQVPWTNMSIDGREFFLVEARGQERPGNAARSSQDLADAYAWKYADVRNTVDEFEDYLKRFPDGVFATVAEERIRSLRTTSQVGQRSSSQPGGGLVASNTPASGPKAGTVASKPNTVKPEAKQNPALVSVLNDNKKPKASLTISASVVQDRAPLPAIPQPPKFHAESYPDCREDYIDLPDPIQKVMKINECMSKLSAFYEGNMLRFVAEMIAHQKTISAMYEEKVANQPDYSHESQKKFYNDMLAEHAASNSNGANFAEYNVTKERYDADQTYLHDRYCFSTGSCGGYPVPPGVGVREE